MVPTKILHGYQAVSVQEALVKEVCSYGGHGLQLVHHSEGDLVVTVPY